MSEERENAESKPDDQRVSIGRIPLKQVRVNKQPSDHNPMNQLVPYLDLFSRLADDELSRLAGVAEEIVAELRKQVVTIDQALSNYVDLLPRLTDRELVRLTGATAKTVRFWRLCQPRIPIPKEDLRGPDGDGIVTRAASAKAGTVPFPAANASSEAAAVADRPSPRKSDSAGAPTPVAASESQPPPQAPKKHAQEAAARLMTFSGDPFPGFDDSAVGFEGVPSPDEVDVALSDLEEEEETSTP